MVHFVAMALEGLQTLEERLELSPITNFDDTYLVTGLQAFVWQHKGYLRRRGHYGFIQRYGGRLALDTVQQAKRGHEAGISSQYIIHRKARINMVPGLQIAGVASIQRGAPLQLPELGALTPPPAMAKWLGLRRPVEIAGPLTHNIQLVTDSMYGMPNVFLDAMDDYRSLRESLTYRKLVTKIHGEDPNARIWTLIPENGFADERRFAARAGLGALAVGLFDDTEAHGFVAQRSILYASDSHSDFQTHLKRNC
jgi:hypothetical protein